MRSAVLGTGAVGQALAAKLVALGHDVAVATRDPQATLARTDPDALGNPPFNVWCQAHPDVELTTPPQATAQAELIVNATNGAGSLAMLELAGEENLSGKLLIDIANPLDFSHGMPPSLFVSNTDSLGEQIQRRFPQARVVKALNTMNCEVMVDPGKVPGEHDVFLCGDDPDAKRQATELLQRFGWPAARIIDLGAISSARGTEMYVALWLRLWGALGTGHFNIAVVRAEA
ncbi:MAG TPA: NAD(P)-binding domain-containing protein [Solirubrobacteraceae bacterium]|jgi:predicted dinucleotide-binding enzyme|nr:NAD(P)-binding domain-containing protein [Solirubrobacteraceae bacterium]